MADAAAKSVVEKSSRTLADGGQAAAGDMPKDGTGTLDPLLVGLWPFKRQDTNESNRSRQAGPVAGAVPGRIEAALCQSP